MLPATFVRDFHKEDSILKTEYRQLGGTDLQVSKLSLGAAPFGGVYGECEEKEASRVVVEALKNGTYCTVL